MSDIDEVIERLREDACWWGRFTRRGTEADILALIADVERLRGEFRLAEEERREAVRRYERAEQLVEEIREQRDDAQTWCKQSVAHRNQPWPLSPKAANEPRSDSK